MCTTAFGAAVVPEVNTTTASWSDERSAERGTDERSAERGTDERSAERCAAAREATETALRGTPGSHHPARMLRTGGPA